MRKSLLYLWFGIGKLPADMTKVFADEGVLLSDEGLKGSVTYRNFHRPGKYAAYQRVGLAVSIVVTNRRLFAYGGDKPLIDAEFSDPRLKEIAFSVEPDGTLLAAFDASLFRNDWSGTLEYRFRTLAAAEFVERIQKLTV